MWWSPGNTAVDSGMADAAVRAATPPGAGVEPAGTVSLSELLLFGPREVAAAAHRAWVVPLAGSVASAVVHATALVTLGMWVVPVELPRATTPLVAMQLEEQIARPELVELQARLDAPAGHGAPEAVALPVERIEYELSPIALAGLVDGDSPPGGLARVMRDIAADLRRGRSAEFFGSVAYGNRFVFVLDASGSMQDGGRYPRAVQELLRTVDRLDEDQSYHVVLFNGVARPMFDLELPRAELVAASDENVARLESWLAHVHPGGWSDPRAALGLALDLEPSAIFVLSDGEFKGPPPAGRLGNETLRLVRDHNRRKIPLHTIAYEDPINRRLLRMLATKTGGTFRFVAPRGKKRLAGSR